MVFQLDTSDMDRRATELRMFIQRERRRFIRAQMESTFEKIVKDALTAKDQDDDDATVCRVRSINESEAKQLNEYLDRLVNTCSSTEQHGLMQDIFRKGLQSSRRRSIYDAAGNQLEPMCLFCGEDIWTIRAGVSRVPSFGGVINYVTPVPEDNDHKEDDQTIHDEGPDLKPPTPPQSEASSPDMVNGFHSRQTDPDKYHSAPASQQMNQSQSEQQPQQGPQLGSQERQQVHPQQQGQQQPQPSFQMPQQEQSPIEKLRQQLPQEQHVPEPRTPPLKTRRVSFEHSAMKLNDRINNMAAENLGYEYLDESQGGVNGSASCPIIITPQHSEPSNQSKRLSQRVKTKTRPKRSRPV